jgi:hypothetical protein
MNGTIERTGYRYYVRDGKLFVKNDKRKRRWRAASLPRRDGNMRYTRGYISILMDDALQSEMGCGACGETIVVDTIVNPHLGTVECKCGNLAWKRDHDKHARMGINIYWEPHWVVGGWHAQFNRHMGRDLFGLIPDEVLEKILRYVVAPSDTSFNHKEYLALKTVCTRTNGIVSEIRTVHPACSERINGIRRALKDRCADVLLSAEALECENEVLREKLRELEVRMGRAMPARIYCAHPNPLFTFRRLG